ncbi:MAG: tRNA (N6-isopentenyl adenosine(37)-C2)-methylthiotransferase MiaB [Deltaproteobacteria bacterium]|nr:tRNA (N6-isopentenyl adenosine(37)-C2)-methylthiotransferase MiaB [Deltaproteobacteria bacterium]
MPINPRKLVYIETFGCRMNDHDSARMLAMLEGMGYNKTDAPERSDLIVINTCSIRDKAEHKVYSTLGRFRILKEQRRSLVIAVSGCMAQQLGALIFKRAPFVDVVFGTHNIHKLKALLDERARSGAKTIAVDFNDEAGGNELVRLPDGPDNHKASVAIMRGCDNLCSYCVVPYTRGAETSRPIDDVLREVQALAGRGVKEVMYLGQNVNSYLTGALGFVELLRKTATIAGIERVRFMTSHPKDISPALIGLFGEEPKLCRHLHLPVQSGSNEVLSRMRRAYTREDYLSKVMAIKRLYPDMAITTDIIAGFPGETDADFRDTMELLRTVRFDNIYSFAYSPRPGTSAMSLDGHLPEDLRHTRLRLLQEEQKAISIELNRAMTGAVLEVMVDGIGRDKDMQGRSRCNRLVHFPASNDAPCGATVDIMITDAYANSLRGVVCDGAGMAACVC